MNSNSNHPKQTALITGASSGIGYDLAKLFAADGYNLVIIARDKEKLIQFASELKEKYGIFVKVIAKDLSKLEAATEIFMELEHDEAICIDVLVNNAGFAVYGPFADTHFTTELDMMRVNMITLVHLTKFFIPLMIKQERGRILNVASTAAFQPGPLMAVYYASKAFVLSFSEALANELRGTGITVTTLCPGPTTSEFQKRAQMEESKLVKGKKIMSSEEVAKIGYEGMKKGKTIVIPGFKNKVLTFLNRLVPRSFAVEVVRRIQEKDV